MEDHPSGGSRDRFEGVYRVLEDAIQAKAFPGCAFGVLAGGEVALAGALGRFTYEPESPAVNAETVYDVASLTKVAATTAVAMLLAQRGQLELDAPLGELLPGFVEGRGGGDPARRVTLKHLLAHNSGLPGYVELFRNAAHADALLDACLRLPLEAEPGTRAEYSDPGFILLGKALETRMDEPLDAWLRRKVYGPLGMAATGFCRRQSGEGRSPHRRGHVVPPLAHPGRGAGRECLGAGGRSGTCRALLECPGPAAIFACSSRRRNGQRSRRRAPSL